MQVCSRCGITIRGSKRCCPLCEGVLAGEPEEPAFPAIPVKKVTRLSILRVAVFLFVIYEVVMLAAMALSGGELGWIPMALLLGVIGLGDVFLVVYHRHSLLKLLTIQTYVGMLGSYYIDRRTHFHGWAVSWVIPCAFLVLVAATVILALCMHLKMAEFSMYLVFDILLSLLQIVPVVTGSNRFIWPAVISMAVLVIFGAGILIFRTGEVRDSAARYFNV